MRKCIAGLWERGFFTKVVLIIITVEFVGFLLRVLLFFLGDQASGTGHALLISVRKETRILFAIGVIAACIALARGELNGRR